jgi:hypothetical protein
VRNNYKVYFDEARIFVHKKNEKKRTLFDNRTTRGSAGGVHSCQPRGMSFEKEREVRGDVREREIMGKLLK